MKNQMSQTFKININGVQLSIYLDSTFTRNDIVDPDYKEYHYHTYYEMFFIKDGSLTVYSSNKTNSYSNCAVLIAPFYNHFTRYKGDTYRISFSFSKTLKNDSTQFSKTLLNVLPKEIKSFKYDEVIFKYLEEIDNLIYISEDYLEKEISNLLELIFISFLKTNYIIKTTHNKLIQKNYFEEIEHVIFAKFTNNISLSELSKQINLSERQTSRIIKEHYGKTYPSLILEKKLDVASTLLKTTDLSINEIIGYLNFNNESYFFKAFKKEFGCTPREYKKEKQNHKNRTEN